MINLRKASLEDAFCLFSWKNEKESLENSLNHEPVLWENHLIWLENTLKNDDRFLWILEKEGKPCGMLRLDRENRGDLIQGEISYLIDRKYRGQGLGKQLLIMAQEQAKILGITVLCGVVLLHNKASAAIFEALGYRKKRKENVYYFRKAVSTIFFRTDMNSTIATGHVMRCLAIADAGREIGVNSIFITADKEGKQIIESRGYKNIILKTQWHKPEEEIQRLEEVIFQYGIEKLLIDSYQVTEKYLDKIRKATEIFYLDDLDKFAYPVQNIICYAPYYTGFSYGRKTEEEGYYLGPAYLPLKKEYRGKKRKKIADFAEHILLLSGGSDPCHMIERILTVLQKEEISITVICGSLFSDFLGLCKKYEERETEAEIHFYQNVNNLEEYMAKADLAVSAGGITLYELAAMGVPTITYSFADNQLYNVKQFQKDDLMEYAGDGRKDKVEEIIGEMLQFYRHHKKEREERSLKMQKLVDGKGAERIARLLT
ncbi:MAG: UDP-2,4-diacetamido-2,4,6-trideoxy-beta-L-altropyranose hydrolase [Lachnospiraceae bacterium]|nr:UDP-2,4-diacetamido-2,4,6-trideoxy-beta-L-altropyranose hydrolase [Lachnospiraceae bacterium]